MVKDEINITEKVEEIFNEELKNIGINCDLVNVQVYEPKNMRRDNRPSDYVAEIELRKDGRFFWNDKLLLTLSNRIINEVQEINKVVYVLDKK